MSQAKKYDVAAYIWPAYTGDEIRSRIFWPEGIGEWQSVKNSQSKPDYVWDRKPVWGYVNEADPYVMEMQINAAVEHGVNVFIYDWYWYDNRPFLENCLNDGFLKAKNNDKMKFYIMWANHDAAVTWDKRISHLHDYVWSGKANREQFETIGKRWINQYFKHPSYYKIDNKPVVSIYDVGNFVEGLGGLENAKAALAWLDAQAKASGLEGVHIQLVKWGDSNLNITGVDGNVDAPQMEVFKELGYDSLTHYQYVHFTNIDRDYEELIPDVLKEWDKVREQSNGKYYPHVSIGWDNNPRFIGFRPGIIRNNPPEQFEKALWEAKAYADKYNDIPLITINSWNEWTESSYLEPDNVYGYGYLEAVKKVFG